MTATGWVFVLFLFFLFFGHSLGCRSSYMKESWQERRGFLRGRHRGIPGEYSGGMWVHCLRRCSVKIAPAFEAVVRVKKNTRECYERLRVSWQNLMCFDVRNLESNESVGYPSFSTGENYRFVWVSHETVGGPMTIKSTAILLPGCVVIAIPRAKHSVSPTRDL